LRSIKPNAIDSHWPHDVLELLLASVLKNDIELTLCVFMYSARYENSAGISKRLQPRGYVHSVAPEVRAIDDEFAEIDAHSQLDPLSPLHVSVSIEHAPLNCDGAAHGAYHTCKLN
jgi:hypothetical protein